MIGRSSTLKSARLRQRRRKAIIGQSVLVLFALGALWGGAFYLSALPSVVVRDIEVVGNTSIASSTIQSSAERFLAGRYFFTVPRSNIFFYPKSAIAENTLAEFPRIETAAVRFKNFHAIRITVRERAPAALWCAADKNCFFLDDAGFVFEPLASSTNATSVTFYGGLGEGNPVGQTYHSSDYFRSLLQFAKKLGAIGIPISAFRELPTGDFEAVTVGGQRIVFGPTTDLSLAADNLQSILSDPTFKAGNTFAKLDYIDVRFGNKIFYKVK